MGRQTRWRRWMRRILFVVGGLVLLFALFVGWALATCFADPPELAYRPAILDVAPPAARGNRVHFGPNWFEARPGHSILYVEGDPYSLGFANAKLTDEYLEAQERSLMGKVREFFPSDVALFGIGLVVLVNNRNLPDYVPVEYQEEILGLADGSGDPFPRYGPRYHRILNYHAAHDIGHWVHDKPVVGCTAFVASGERTAAGTLLVGRNFDFEAGRVFDTNKIIGCYRPAKGFAFLSVAWPGMAGAVTGLNERGIYCSLNGAHSSDRDNIGTPVSLVVRQVLQYADSLDAAIDILREAKVFVSDSYLVADGPSGRAAVVEKSPATFGVREMETGLLLQSNHFECPEFSGDEGNREYMRIGTSVKRRARLAELIDAQVGRLDPAAAVAILRDTSGSGGRRLALGNRGAVNPCIATHSVVADVSRGVLWVSRGPHQLGAFDAYSIERFGESIARPLAESPLLSDGSYERLLESRSLIDGGTRVDLERALELNPGDAEALCALAERLEQEGDLPGALKRYREALAAAPPFAEEIAKIEAAIAKLSGRS